MTRQERFAAMVEKRNRRVLTAALQETAKHGWSGFTRDGVAKRAGVAAGCVNAAFGNMAGLRDAVMRHAVANGLNDVIVQGLAASNEIARNAPPEVKARALATLS